MITRRFTQRYMLALALVAGLTIVGQVLVQRQLQNQTADSYLVNYAGQQRYQSQQIVKDALLLTNPDGLVTNRAVRSDLTRVLARWERYHTDLQTGRLTDLAITVLNSDATRTLFNRLEPDFRAISRAAHELLSATTSGTQPRVSTRRNVQTILSHSYAVSEPDERHCPAK